jgi:CubicO group peptidase (beta-lactamase class C family)
MRRGGKIVSDAQKHVQEAIDHLVESGAERGLQVAVYQHGELVVDAVAGVADPATGRPVTSDTPFFSASTGKSMTSTVVHVLAERGVFGYDTPIVELWPEFGAHGKQAATIRHALTHSVGVPGVPADTTPEDLGDWQKMCAAITDAQPWWEPGTKFGYHALTYGYLIGEIVRRATGKPISQVLREEVAGPLGVADELFFSVPQAELGRLARLEAGDEPMGAEQIKQLEVMMPLFFKVAPPAVQPSADLYNRTDFLTSDVPSGGSMSARAVARLYAALLGEVDGVRLISPTRLHEIAAVAVDDVDQIFGNPARMALGYAIGRPMSHPSESTPPPDTATVFGWSGVGGSHASADTATGIAFALTKNRFTATDFSTAAHIAEIVTKALGES